MELRLKEKLPLTTDVISFIFGKPASFNFTPGQFLEWTLPHKNADERGERRWFTISSSPTEENIRLTTKFAEQSSSFKNALQQLTVGAKISAANLEGDFVLPQEKTPLVFIAGGIGITPFRSMIKYLVDQKQKWDIVLLYSNKVAQDIIFKDLLEEASTAINLKTLYFITNGQASNKNMQAGFISKEKIEELVPDWRQRTFYVSGPEPMVEAFEKMFGAMGISDQRIKRDYFPGYLEAHQ